MLAPAPVSSPSCGPLQCRFHMPLNNRGCRSGSRLKQGILDKGCNAVRPFAAKRVRYTTRGDVLKNFKVDQLAHITYNSPRAPPAGKWSR